MTRIHIIQATLKVPSQLHDTFDSNTAYFDSTQTSKFHLLFV